VDYAISVIEEVCCLFSKEEEEPLLEPSIVVVHFFRCSRLIKSSCGCRCALLDLNSTINIGPLELVTTFEGVKFGHRIQRGLKVSVGTAKRVIVSTTSVEHL